MNQVIVTRYDEGGVQTKGYNKILSAIQIFEELILDFEKYTCKKYTEAFDNLPEPSWWARNVQEIDKENLLIRSNECYEALYWLFKEIERDALVKQKRSTWIAMESLAFNDKVDVARHYETYDNLRNLIRCGSTFLLDDATCKFVNTFNKRLTIFQ